MSLSPFYSFKSRFVTYLLNCPRIIIFSITLTVNEPKHQTHEDAKNCLTRLHDNGRYGNRQKVQVGSVDVGQ